MFNFILFICLYKKHISIIYIYFFSPFWFWSLPGGRGRAPCHRILLSPLHSTSPFLPFPSALPPVQPVALFSETSPPPPSYFLYPLRLLHRRSSFPSALTPLTALTPLMPPPRFPAPSHRSAARFSASLFLPSGRSHVSFTLRLLFYRRRCMPPLFLCHSITPFPRYQSCLIVHALSSLSGRSLFPRRKRNGVIRLALIGSGLIGLNHFGEPQIERCH